MAVSPAADIATTMIRSLKAHLNAAATDLEQLGGIGTLDFTFSDACRYNRQIGKVQEIADLAAEMDFPSVSETAQALLERFGA